MDGKSYSKKNGTKKQIDVATQLSDKISFKIKLIRGDKV